MKVLEEVSKLRNKKINKIEKLKEEQKALDFWNDFETICSGKYEDLREVHEKHLLKCFGIYDKGSSDSFTIRIRIPLGQLTQEQASKFSQVAYKYGKSTIDLTTRGQMEFRHLNLHELPIVLKELESVGITTFQTAGDNFILSEIVFYLLLNLKMWKLIIQKVILLIFFSFYPPNYNV